MSVEMLAKDETVELLFNYSIIRHVFYVLDIAVDTEDQKSTSYIFKLKELMTNCLGRRGKM